MDRHAADYDRYHNPDDNPKPPRGWSWIAEQPWPEATRAYRFVCGLVYMRSTADGPWWAALDSGGFLVTSRARDGYDHDATPLEVIDALRAAAVALARSRQLTCYHLDVDGDSLSIDVGVRTVDIGVQRSSEDEYPTVLIFSPRAARRIAEDLNTAADCADKDDLL